MIYPSARAAALAAAGAIPAFLIAVLVPAQWSLGLLWLSGVIALTLVDAAAGAGAGMAEARVTAPAQAAVGADVTIGLAAGFTGRPPRRTSAVIGTDDRLRSVGPDPRDLAPGAGITITRRAVRRGRAALGPVWLRWSGPFGLARHQRRIALHRDIRILPDIRAVRDEAAALSRQGMTGPAPQLELGAGSEFQALAEYRSGMDRRAIDWKRSARHGQLLAKEFRTERNNEIVLAIDAGRLMSEPVDGVPRIDRAISAALLCAFAALRLGDRVSLFGFDARPRVASGAVGGVAAFAPLQELAASLDYSSEETNYTLALTTLGARLHRRSLIVIFTEFVDPTGAELMLRSTGRLLARHLVLFVVMADQELEALAAHSPDTADDVARAITAGALLRERRIVVERLRRLGAHIVEARHDALGPELLRAYVELKRRDLL